MALVSPVLFTLGAPELSFGLTMIDRIIILATKKYSRRALNPFSVFKKLTWPQIVCWFPRTTIKITMDLAA